MRPCCGVLHHLLRGVRVDVQRKACRGVTHEVLHALDVCAAGDHHCGGGVPEIMHTGVRPADAGDNSFVVLFVVLVESMDSKMCSQLVRKNEVIRIVPQLTSPETIFRLAALFVTEIIKTERGWFNGARLPTLGGVGNVRYNRGGNISNDAPA